MHDIQNWAMIFSREWRCASPVLKFSKREEIILPVLFLWSLVFGLWNDSAASVWISTHASNLFTSECSKIQFQEFKTQNVFKIYLQMLESLHLRVLICRSQGLYHLFNFSTGLCDPGEIFLRQNLAQTCWFTLFIFVYSHDYESSKNMFWYDDMQSMLVPLLSHLSLCQLYRNLCHLFLVTVVWVLNWIMCMLPSLEWLELVRMITRKYI